MTDDERRAKWGAARAKFLRELEACGEFRASADAARLQERALYALKRTDAAFAAECDAARGAWTKARLATIAGADDWRAHAWLLERAENAREARAKRALLEAQVEQTRRRTDGTLPADNLNVRVAVDPAALASKIDALAARLAAAPPAGDAGGGAGEPE